jgi:hypothetical protein
VSTVPTIGRSEIDGATPDLAFAQISESVMRITAPTFTDVAIAAFRQEQARTGEARDPHTTVGVKNVHWQGHPRYWHRFAAHCRQPMGPAEGAHRPGFSAPQLLSKTT